MALPKDETVEFVLADHIAPSAGYRFYSAVMPRPHFIFALWSVVDGLKYGKDGRHYSSKGGPQATGVC